MRKHLIALLLTFLPLSVYAHSQLIETFPIDTSTINEVPTEIMLVFKNRVRLTTVTSDHAVAGSSKLKLGKKIQFQTNYTIPLEGDDSGSYTIEWRGLGKDGHILKGTFSFTVQ